LDYLTYNVLKTI